MESSDFKSRLEIASRLGAAFAVILYVVGFMVLTIADASYGIVAFGLLHAKVLYAGILFSIFLALPILLTARAFGLFGFQMRYRPENVGTKPKAVAEYLSRMPKLFHNFISAWAEIFFILIFIFADLDFSRNYFLVCFGFLIVAIFAERILRPHFSRSPVAYFWATLVLMIAGCGSLALIRKWIYFELLVWFLVVGSFAHQIEPALKEPRLLRDKVSWTMILVHVVAVVSSFAFLFYPKIQQRIGGGRPEAATFQFTGSSPIDGATKTRVWLIDEVDDGYYTLLTPADHEAIFIAKPLVSAIYFEGK